MRSAMTIQDRAAYITLRVRVFELSQAMVEQPEDDQLWFDWQLASNEVESLWNRFGPQLIADPSVEDEIRRRTGLI